MCYIYTVIWNTLRLSISRLNTHSIIYSFQNVLCTKASIFHLCYSLMLHDLVIQYTSQKIASWAPPISSNMPDIALLLLQMATRMPTNSASAWSLPLCLSHQVTSLWHQSLQCMVLSWNAQLNSHINWIWKNTHFCESTEHFLAVLFKLLRITQCINYDYLEFYVFGQNLQFA